VTPHFDGRAAPGMDEESIEALLLSTLREPAPAAVNLALS